MAYTSANWPIAAAMHQFPGTLSDGRSVQDADAGEWVETLSEVSGLGFRHLDLTDSWLRIADLSPSRLVEFEMAVAAAGLAVPSLSITRRSVIDPEHGEANLEYSHRTIDAAAALGVDVLSIGLHRALTATQREQLWFWNAPGAADPVGDADVWRLAVERISQLGRHAEENGMVVSLELYEDTYLGTADSAVRLVQDIGLDSVGINPDIGNLVRLHRPIERWQDLLARTLPFANYWQVKNYFRDEDPTTGAVVAIPAPLELGFINYRAAVRDALSLGFQGVICCEHYGGDGLGVSAANMRYLRTLLPAAANGSAAYATDAVGRSAS